MKRQFKPIGKGARLRKLFSAGGALFFALILSLQARAQQEYHFEWVHSAGGHEVSVSASKPVLDGQGNVYLTTNFLFTNGDSLFFDDGTAIESNINNTVLVKYAPDGQLLWTKNLNGTQYIIDIASDQQGDIYLLGSYSNTAIFDTITLTANSSATYLAKFNTSGNVVWVKNILHQSDSAYFGVMSTDPQGNVYLGGSFQAHILSLGAYLLSNSDTIGGTGPNTGILSADYVLAKYDQSGAVVWTKSGGIRDFHEDVSAITNDGLGHLYFNFQQEHAWTVGPTDTLKDYLIKCDASGAVLWTDTFQDLGIAQMITSGKGNSLYTTGFYGHYGIIDSNITFGDGAPTSGGIYIAKFDSAGNALWGKSSLSNPSDVIAFSKGMAFDNSGNICVSGEYINSIIGLVSQLIFGADTITMHSDGQFTWDSRDAFLVRYSAQGNLIEARSIGGNRIDENSGIVGTSDGMLYMTGRYFSPVIDFDTITLSNSPVVSPDTLYYSRLYLAKYVPGTGGNDTTNTIQPLDHKDFINVYPNPTTGVLHLQSSIGIKAIQLFDVQGRRVFQQNLPYSAKEYQLDLQKQPNGIYWLQIRDTEGAIAVKKIILK